MDKKDMNRMATFLSVLVMVLSALAAAPLYGATGGRAAGDATITGTVTDYHTGLPLAGVNVHLSNAMVSADCATASSGTYQFIVAPDLYDLQFSMAGYQTASAQVTGVMDGTTTQDQALAPLMSKVTGTVTSGANAIAGADVFLLGSTLEPIKSNATGNFVFNLYGYDRTYTVWAVSSGMYGFQTSFQLALGATQNVTADLAPIPGATSTVWGYVFDNNSMQPVEGARVTFTDKSGTQWVGVVTGVGGYYSVSLPEALYDVKVEAAGYLTFTTTLDLVGGVQKDYQIRAIPASGTHISGKVSDSATSGALAGADVALVDASGVRNSVKSGADGSYQMTTYQGNFTLEASAANYFVHREALTVGAVDLIKNVALISIPDRTLSVWGYTKDISNNPVSGVKVVLYDLEADHTGYMSETTSAAGGYFSISTYAGHFLLVGEADGRSTAVQELSPSSTTRLDMVLDVLSATDVTEKLVFSDWGNISYSASVSMPNAPGSTRWDIDHNFGNGDGKVTQDEANAYLDTLLARGPTHRDTRNYLTVDGLMYTYDDGSMTVTADNAVGNDTDASRIVERYAYNLTSNASVPHASVHALKFNATYDTASMTSSTEIVLPYAYELRGGVQATSAVNVNGTSDLTIDPLTAPQGSASASEWVTVSLSHNEPPLADTDGDKTVKPGTVIYFDASTSSDDSGIANYTWDFGDGTLGYGVTVNHTYNVSAGTPKTVFIVVLKVIDLGGLTNKTTVNVTIDGQSPVANFDIANQTVVERTQLVEVNASGVNSSSDNVGIARYSWDWGDGTSGEGAATNHTYYVPGTYNLTLNVTDLAGNWANKTVVITVLDNTSPVARFIANVTVAPAGIAIDFNGTTSSDNVAVVQWVWDFGDGSAKVSGNSAMADVNHTYAAEGTYNVTLNVTDGIFFNETTQLITVTPPLIFADINTTNLKFSRTDPTTDDTVTISVKVTNQGEKSAENFTVRFQAGSSKVGDVKVRSLAIGQSKTVSVDWKPSKKGTFQITVTADATSVIPESNETNNIAEGKLTVKESQMSLIIGIVAVLVVIAVVVAFFLYTRRSKKEYDEEEEEEEEDEDEEAEEEDEEEADEDEEAEEMECPKCFAEVKPTDKKCPSCGANLRR